jgi:class 3 adenylate cyclase
MTASPACDGQGREGPRARRGALLAPPGNGIHSPVRHLSFRTKLLLAMMAVVFVATGAILFVTQRRALASYEHLLRSEFERQIQYHSHLQEERLSDQRTLGDGLAEWAREQSRGNPDFLRELRPSLLPDEPAATPRDRLRRLPTLLSTNASFLELLRRVDMDPRGSGPAGRGPGRGAGFGGGQMPGQGLGQSGGPMNRFRRGGFVSVVDERGGVLLTVPPDWASAVAATRSPGMERQRLELVSRALQASQDQQVGCAAFPAALMQRRSGSYALMQSGAAAENETNQIIYEVVFNKVVAPDSNRVLGAFVIGTPMPELLQTGFRPGTTSAPPPFLTGLMLERGFYADPDDIPEDLGAKIGELMRQRIQPTPKAQEDFVVEDGGRHYWAFVRLLNPDSSFPPAYQVCLYSMDQTLADLRSLRFRILGAGVVALLAAFGLSLLVAHSFSRPLLALVAGTQAVRRGDLSVRVPVRSRDELGHLAESFNEMTVGLAQKERYRTVLNLIADSRVAERLVQGELTLGGEEREVTVLFCDIRGFTAYTQHRAPKEVIELLNEHMTALAGVVKAHNGVLDKFVGDLLMAIFGAPLAEEGDTLNAARCALALLVERARLNAVSPHKLEIGIGLASGRVVAGCMGSAERLSYTVLGERVNLASRLCDEAGAGEVLIDEATVNSLGPRLRAVPGGARPLPGFAAPVPVWRLIAIAEEA